MQYKGYEILNLPVINLKNTEKIGVVEDIVFDPEKQQIIGLVLTGKGWLKEEQVIPYQKINSIGRDAVTIKDETVIEELDGEVEHLDGSSGKVMGSTVLTNQGQDLGVIDDIFLNPSTGRINGYEISDGVVEDIINGRGILSASNEFKYGDDVVVVPDVANYQQFEMKED
ncbi:PRC-barrel domain-containing protein [Fuchsiella alkaliacetigena]|uniref:PRC-barrel domain-containing protein n=1 Tax=Fuchsiella alkaliacetigena TaxID=957042 RepID=UPI00200A18EC|nr:PRC-barrel domain-containing protein [Fuchsiella alkaliacetigena]MCK8825083.1 PRC-barrel domain-containing protein [Fuchsiella alkaliacetigena]